MELNDTTSDLEPIQTTADVTDVAPVVETPTANEPEGKMDLGAAVAKAFEKHITDDPAKPTKALPHSAPVAVPDGKVTDPITGRVAEAMKPPAGWTPALREKWGSIDPMVQKFVRDQEKHISQTLQDAAEAKKFQSEFKDIAAPYEALFRQYQTDGKTVAKDLFTQWHALTTGTPQRKAELLHNLILHFQPDFAVLGQLAAQGRPAVTQAPRPQEQPQNVQQEVQRILAEREEQQLAQRTGSAIEQFAADPKNEFYDDVRELMGKAINAGFITGSSEAEYLKNAYDFACQQHPEVKGILAGRAPAVMATSQPRPKAVGSVKPSLGVAAKSKGPAKSMSVGDAATEAFRRHGLLN